MTRNRYWLKVAFTTAITALILVVSGCSDDPTDDAVTDNTFWSLMQIEEIEQPRVVWPLDTDKAIVGANNEHVYITEDGGLSWDAVSIDPSTGRSPSDIYFAGNRGIMVGLRGMFYTTTNDGQTWTNALPAEVPAADLHRIIKPASDSDNPLFVCGDEGVLLKSIDGGATWDYMELMIDKFFEDFPIIDGETGETLRVVDTTLYATQEKFNFFGGWAPNDDEIYLLCDTLQTDEEFYVLVSDDAGATGSWQMHVMETPVKWFDIYTGDDSDGIIISDSDGRVDYISIGDTSISTSLNQLISGASSLHRIFFVNSDVGWIIGDGGLVARSLNGGDSWSKIDVDVTGAITDIRFIDEDEGWLVGNDASRNSGAIKVTHDGGDTWNFRSYGVGSVNLNAIYFDSPDRGWIAGKSGRIARTTDGGITWLHQDANTSRSLQDVNFRDANNGYAVGFSLNTGADTLATILQSTNGGILWTSIDSLFGYRLNKVDYLDASNAIAVGNNGLILKSDDWHSPIESGVSVELFGLDAVDANTVFACGQAGVIIKSTDGGATWTQQTTGNEQTLLSIDMVNANVGYACGNLGTVLKTTNGGNSWSALELPRNSATVYKSVAFADTESGWIVGVFGYILHTADGGETWYRQLEGFSEATLNSVFIYDSNNAWIVGNGGTMLEMGRN